MGATINTLERTAAEATRCGGGGGAYFNFTGQI